MSAAGFEIQPQNVSYEWFDEGDRVVGVSASDLDSLAVTKAGRVFTWRGDLDQLVPEEVALPLPVKAVSAGDNNQLFAVAENGTMFSWGNGKNGRLGHGDWFYQPFPRQVGALRGTPVATVSAGDGHSLAVTADGAVFSWGVGRFGALGHGDDADQLVPKEVAALRGTPVAAVSAGYTHSLAVTADGAVFSWGVGSFGALGHGDHQDQLVPKEVAAPRGTPVKAVAASMFHSLASAEDGAVFSWGHGYNGCLGHGDREDRLLPKQVEALRGTSIAAVSSVQFHSLALTARGAVFSWGRASKGQLGHGDEIDLLVPREVVALRGTPVAAVSAGSYHSLAVTASGKVFCWGWRDRSRLLARIRRGDVARAALLAPLQLMWFSENLN